MAEQVINLPSFIRNMEAQREALADQQAQLDQLQRVDGLP